MPRKSDVKLSKSVLNLKFMQKTKLKLEEKEKARLERERQIAFLKNGRTDDSQASELDSEQALIAARQNEIMVNKSLPFLEELAFGRMSFQGFNPRVEKLMIYYHRINNGLESESEEETDDEHDVTNQEMAETLKGTIGKKFAKRMPDRRKDHGNVEDNTSKLNFDESEVRGLKRPSNTANRDESQSRPRKFLKPSED